MLNIIRSQRNAYENNSKIQPTQTITMANIKKADNIKCRQASETTETIQLLVSRQNSTTLQSMWYLFVKHHVIHQFHYVFFQPWETKCLYKDLQMNGYSSSDHFSLKRQMSSMSINRWINKLQNIQVTEFNSEIKRTNYWCIKHRLITEYCAKCKNSDTINIYTCTVFNYTISFTCNSNEGKSKW